jgi:hypothetical protein
MFYGVNVVDVMQAPRLLSSPHQDSNFKSNYMFVGFKICYKFFSNLDLTIYPSLHVYQTHFYSLLVYSYNCSIFSLHLFIFMQKRGKNVEGKCQARN